MKFIEVRCWDCKYEYLVYGRGEQGKLVLIRGKCLCGGEE